MRGLVVVHNLNATPALGRALQADGVRTLLHRSADPRDTLEYLRKTDCDAVVFECPVASCQGDCLPRHLRAEGNPVPILVIAKRGSADTWIGCLEAGANDYVAMPYKKRVLKAHVRAMVRRQGANGVNIEHPTPNVEHRTTLSPLLQVRDLTFDPETDIARRGGKVIELTPLPARLLAHLMRNKGKLCLRKDIIADVWGSDSKPSDGALDTLVNRLRAEVDTKFDTRLIETDHWKGYWIREDG